MLTVICLRVVCAFGGLNCLFGGVLTSILALVLVGGLECLLACIDVLLVVVVVVFWWFCVFGLGICVYSLLWLWVMVWLCNSIDVTIEPLISYY